MAARARRGWCRVASVGPGRRRAGHDPRTVAQALAVAAPGRAREVVTAFVSGADTGLRVIGISVLILGGLVVLHSQPNKMRWHRGETTHIRAGGRAAASLDQADAESQAG